MQFLLATTVKPLLIDITYNGHLSAMNNSKYTDETYHN